MTEAYSQIRDDGRLNNFRQDDPQHQALRETSCNLIDTNRTNRPNRSRCPTFQFALNQLDPGDTIGVYRLDRLVSEKYALQTLLAAIAVKRAHINVLLETVGDTNDAE